MTDDSVSPDKNLNDILRYDPLAEIEKATGKRYQDIEKEPG
jgi:hypothetical protein